MTKKEAETAERIEPLKKVTLSLETGSARGAMDFTPEPLIFTFIFGLGVEGLTPFEKELDHRGEGSETVLSLKKDQIQDVFQHLDPPPLPVPESAEQFFLRVRVQNVTRPQQREVIAALAVTARCRNGCCGH